MKTPRLLLALVFLAPAVMGAIHAGRLAAACWITGAFGTDPLVTRIRGDDGPMVPREHADLYQRASELARLDYRYPDRLARSILGAGRGETSLLDAHVLQEEAVRRLPCYVLPRLRLAAIALELGQATAADREMIAALALAPIWRGTARDIEAYFRDRASVRVVRSDRDRELLRAVLRLPGELGDRIAVRLLSHVLMTPDTAFGALRDADVAPKRGVRLLLAAEQWTMAEAYAARHGEMIEASALLANSERLLSARAFTSARRKAELAREMMGERFDGWPVLARCRFADGDSAGGVAAVGRALDAGLEPEEASRILSDGRLSEERRVSFWSAWIEAGDDRPLAKLELARALVAAGHGLQAGGLMDDLAARYGLEGEASYLRAQVYVKEGKPRMALEHAERALRADPSSGRFRGLRDRLRKELR